MLQRRDEREADRLPGDGHVLGVSLRHDAPVGHRLDPRHLRQEVADRPCGVARGTEIHRSCAPLPPAQHVETDVRRDAVQPRAERGAAFEAVEASPGANERLLDGVLCLHRPEHPVAVRGQLDPVLLEAHFEVTGDRRGGARRIGHDAIVGHR